MGSSRDTGTDMYPTSALCFSSEEPDRPGRLGGRGREPGGPGHANRGVDLGVVGLVAHEGAGSGIEGEVIPAERNAVAARSRISLGHLELAAGQGPGDQP